MDDSHKRKTAPKSMEELQQAWSEAPCSVRRGYRQLEIVPIGFDEPHPYRLDFPKPTETPLGRNHLGETVRVSFSRA